MYAVLIGEARFPFYQLLIQNIWESRETSKKMVIQHCRVITQLLRGAGVIPRGARTAVIAMTPFDRPYLNKPNFQLKETLTHFVLRDKVNKRRQEFLNQQRCTRKPSKRRRKKDAANMNNTGDERDLGRIRIARLVIKIAPLTSGRYMTDKSTIGSKNAILMTEWIGG